MRPFRKRNLSALFSFLTIALPMAAQRPVPGDTDWQQYIQLVRRNTLNLPRSQPFLLRVDYQLYDLAGQPSSKGTAELSWDSARTHSKISSPTLTVGDDAAPQDEIKTHIRENFLVSQALTLFIHPLDTTPVHEGFAFHPLSQTVADQQLKCTALVPSAGAPAETPSFCIDSENRASFLTGAGPFLGRRENFRHFQNHEVPLDITLSYEGRTAISAHITELDALSPQPERPAVPDAFRPQKIPGSVLAGGLLKKKQPKYPKDAKKQHIGGRVIVWALITTEGKIIGLDVIASPDPLLSQSSIDAVKEWIYQPYLLGGKPTEVDTTITVTFALGH